MNNTNTPRWSTQDKCRICSSPNLYPILNLGNTPLADKFPSTPTEQEEAFPLRVAVCQTCWLVQLLTNVDDALLFGNDYAFYTGASPSSIAYFADYAKSVMARFTDLPSTQVLEIASNDGTLLKHFKDAGWKPLGVDPTENTAAVAKEQGIRTITKFFGRGIINDIIYNPGDTDKPALILANNVLAHVVDPNDLIAGVKALLHPDGVFVVEFQYFPQLFFNNAFDHVYHEHRSFFSLAPVKRLMEQHGLRIFDIQHTEAQGGSLRVYVCHQGSTRKETGKVGETRITEGFLGFDLLQTYMGFQARVDYARASIIGILRDLKEKKKTVYGMGASAKSTTLLNACGITPDLLPLIVDKTPYKYGKYTPGTKIRVVEEGTADSPDYYLVLVWNYVKGIVARQEVFLRGGGHLIVPFSSSQIEII